MAETVPLKFTKKLGALFVANAAAQTAMSTLEDGEIVHLKITKSRGNNARMSLYWVVLGIAAPMLSEKCDGDALDETLLHRVLKDRRGLYSITTLPSGEILKNYDSVSFAKMSEPDRSEYINWAFETLSKWLGVSVEELTREGKLAA